MSEPIMMLARAINAQKADALGTSALLLAVIKSFPSDQQAKVFEEFEKEISMLQSALSDSDAESDISEGVDRFARSIEERRSSLAQS
ncbi:hypothetical protein [Stutzerimonas kunmingensis]|uniref:hypothetical protein n=1 Tax=Stutzerimonas kunmingensis TaxID=1211807 RepID=UPI00289ECA30|nr:hypothetical protein [Stutzerimonas kunmingensis]